MKPALLDVNVLVALLDPGHIHYPAAHQWLERQARTLVTCPITINGCLRVLCSTKYPEGPPLASDVGRRLTTLQRRSTHQFWPEDISLLDESRFDLTKIAGPKQVSDVYLLGIAVARGGVLATLDRSVTWGAVVGAKASDIEFVGG